MYTSNITINSPREDHIQSTSRPTSHGAIKGSHKPPVKINPVFVSKVSRTLSLDSSIPAMPSTMSCNILPCVPVHGEVLSSSKSYLPSTQKIVEEKSISRKSSGASSSGSSDLYFPGDLGHNGKEDKLPLRGGGLKNPIWVTPTICTHQGNNGEMCYLCRKDVNNVMEGRPDFTQHRPDFTVLNLYNKPRKPKSKCKCGTITTLTTCFSVFVMLLILAFVIYNEVVIKQRSPIRVHYKM